MQLNPEGFVTRFQTLIVERRTSIGEDFFNRTRLATDEGGKSWGDYFINPDQFNIDQFSPERAEDRSHRFAWVPFDGGAHKCIGMHFATIRVKGPMRALLRHHRIVRTTIGNDRPSPVRKVAYR